MRSIALVLGVLLIGCSGGDSPLTDAGPIDADLDGFSPPDCCLFDDGPPACQGLDPLACRSTEGCAPMFCPGCNCNPGYLGCFDVNWPPPPPACPVLDCPTPSCCREDTDCTGASCIAPGESPGCGACQPVTSECATDADCRVAGVVVGAVPICQPVACACTPANACVPGCTVDGDCGDGETCDAPNGRCVPRACGASAPCPADFDCIGTTCARRACETDATCDGFCVEHACRTILGACSPPPG